jgi:hypothetical protein
MNVKTMTLTVCALLLGAAAGYFAPGKGGGGMKQDAPQETRCAAAIADNGAQASIKALRARVAELEKQLAAKPADEKAPAPDSGPSRFVESHVERMKKMAVDDPQRYAQITNRIANWRRRRSEQARSRIDFLSSIDTSRMSAEAREVHEELQQLVSTLQTDEGIEQLAHESLGWVREGEQSVSVMADGSSDIGSGTTVDSSSIPSGSVPAPTTWYSPALDALFGYEG